MRLGLSRWTGHISTYNPTSIVWDWGRTGLTILNFLFHIMDFPIPSPQKGTKVFPNVLNPELPFTDSDLRSHPDKHCVMGWVGDDYSVTVAGEAGGRASRGSSRPLTESEFTRGLVRVQPSPAPRRLPGPPVLRCPSGLVPWPHVPLPRVPLCSRFPALPSSHRLLSGVTGLECHSHLD